MSYDSIYMKFAEQANPQRQKIISGFQGVRGAENVLELDGGDGCTTL